MEVQIAVAGDFVSLRDAAVIQELDHFTEAEEPEKRELVLVCKHQNHRAKNSLGILLVLLGTHSSEDYWYRTFDGFSQIEGDVVVVDVDDSAFSDLQIEYADSSFTCSSIHALVIHSFDEVSEDGALDFLHIDLNGGSVLIVGQAFLSKLV